MSITQATIFSFILVIAYNSNSYTSGDEPEETIAQNVTFLQAETNDTVNDETASYSFSSKLCPFGFEPLLITAKRQLSAQAESTTKVSKYDGQEDQEMMPLTNISFGNVTTSVTNCVAPGQNWALQVVPYYIIICNLLSTFSTEIKHI